MRPALNHQSERRFDSKAQRGSAETDREKLDANDAASWTDSPPIGVLVERDSEIRLFDMTA